ncbi:unnamed protein product [Allacma fusca]|uniref:Uncharacterized protein n=1 Tax=Allacma fusca TaxID=39272 RepID=A0A8J2NXQ3_9HEXA|nr:unnamed protein product [Allacma fusca]
MYIKVKQPRRQKSRFLKSPFFGIGHKISREVEFVMFITFTQLSSWQHYKLVVFAVVLFTSLTETCNFGEQVRK